MFERFRDEGVNNLIWVWTTETGDNDWYPGDDYVDIIGRDLYGKEASAVYEEYAAIDAAYPDRIIGLSECGTVGLISEQWAAGARWSWFMPWYGNSDDGNPHATDAWWTDAMRQDFVITRDDVNIRF
jgi:mannan endo-1,4-beta-mannosidase